MFNTRKNKFITIGIGVTVALTISLILYRKGYRYEDSAEIDLDEWELVAVYDYREG